MLAQPLNPKSLIFESWPTWRGVGLEPLYPRRAIHNDFISCKGEQGAKEAGKMRSEGKEYVVKDGDVLNFLFNV